MSNIRANRVAEQIKKELGDILTLKIKDPRIGFVTVTDVEVTGDLQQAKVFISVLGDEKKKNETLRSEEHTSELQSRGHLVCRLLLEKKKKNDKRNTTYLYIHR